jgi:hypothetical protein
MHLHSICLFAIFVNRLAACSREYRLATGHIPNEEVRSVTNPDIQAAVRGPEIARGKRSVKQLQLLVATKSCFQTSHDVVETDLKYPLRAGVVEQHRRNGSLFSIENAGSGASTKTESKVRPREMEELENEKYEGRVGNDVNASGSRRCGIHIPSGVVSMRTIVSRIRNRNSRVPVRAISHEAQLALQ